MKTMLILLIISLMIVGFIFGRGIDEIDRRTVRRFDLARYMGDWYEIARYDHPFERRLDAVRTTYTLRDRGIDVINSGRDTRSGRRRTIRGKARTTTQPGRLRVAFFWRFYSDYNILELGEAYDWAVIGGSSAKRLWILSRTPTLPAHTLQRILQLVARRGYAVDKLLFVGQQETAARPEGMPAEKTAREETARRERGTQTPEALPARAGRYPDFPEAGAEVEVEAEVEAARASVRRERVEA